jgi:hypothetical protein
MKLETNIYSDVKFIDSSYFDIMVTSKQQYVKSITNELMLFRR